MKHLKLAIVAAVAVAAPASASPSVFWPFGLYFPARSGATTEGFAARAVPAGPSVVREAHLSVDPEAAMDAAAVPVGDAAPGASLSLARASLAVWQPGNLM